MLAPALSQHVFFAQFQHREPADFSKIMGDTGFDHHVSISSRQPTNDLVRLVSKQNYQLRTSLSIWFRNTIIFERSDHASTQNGGTPGASRPTCSSRGLWRTQPRSMDGASLLRPRQPLLAHPIGVRGVSSDDTGHCFRDHQDPCGRWVFGSTAVQGGWAKCQSAPDDQGQNSACARSVRSSGPRYRYARCRTPSRNARRLAPSADYRGCEWVASALWCLPRLRVPRRDLPQFDKHKIPGP